MMRRLLSSVAALTLLVACGSQPAQQGPAASATPGAAGDGGATVRLYTSVTQDTVDAVVAAYNDEHPEVDVEVFRAPTGELTARIAAEQREGGLRADVLWLTDPVSMEEYERQGVLAKVPEDAAAAVPDRLRSETYVGTRILNMVIVHGRALHQPPSAWRDLADARYRGAVALPDPSFAGSALGALGYFALSGDAELGFYRDLAANKAVQVQSPDEVTNGVAEGQFDVGMTLDNSVRGAAEKGSPVTLAAPKPGAIAIYSPVAVVAGSSSADEAAGFVSFTVTDPAQEAIARTGWEPVLDTVAWPHDLAQVYPDWEKIADQRDELLKQYTNIFGG